MGLLDWFRRLNERGFEERGGKRLTWRGYLPLSVYVGDPALLDDVERGVGHWNGRVLRRLFLHPVMPLPEIQQLMLRDKGGGLRGVVFVSTGTPDGQPGCADLRFDTRTGELWNVWVRLTRNPQPAVVLHELGHALGLAHDPSPWSVMYRYGLERPGAITASDIDRIRRAYHHAPRMPRVTVSSALDDFSEE